MSPAQHLEWFADNTAWFLALQPSSLDEPVPACPGWNVENVLTHLAYGLGLAYPCALDAAPESADDEAFAEVSWPAEAATGAAVFTEFECTMTACLETFRRTDPQTPCYTYAGPGVAAFWFRRAAIETTLHRMDVAEALGLNDGDVPVERANDAIAESVEFALPLAAQLASVPTSAVSVRVRQGDARFQLGQGDAAAEITGDATAVLSALWGRSKEGISVKGDKAAADAWMSVVEQAFAGR